MKKNYTLAIKSAIEAGKEIMRIYELPNVEVENKEDKSLLTLADKSSNKIINNFLKETEFPIISEENEQLDYGKRKGWDTVWIIDPLDGTKEFIKKNGEFTVNVALCSFGSPIFGVIYAPVTRELYYAITSKKKAYKTILDNSHNSKRNLFDDEDLIFPKKPLENIIRVVCSRSHMNKKTSDFILKLHEKFSNIEIVSKGSSLKFCIVAEGGAHIYPRFAPTMEWDTAAGHAICSAVGLKIVSEETSQEISYNKISLSNPNFLIKNL
ncbi:3'(2'),5'-bisphosphate nucleotidase CysQ [Pseudozobellia sp. WGM2]|uniref:3'(2'),5'-bisphosphate nucleotidase CysQ n=1 Tax=Pseudozobellia sp. WGM2 TaxID=2787625 RepID=UPI001ADEC8FF|nr:3'(2'),5'-bisphosphate nucleotidase CysQ [Pseudozobellia sp. WGM2]